MRPRRTHRSNATYVLEGGNEDNDLWVERTTMEGSDDPIIASVFVPTDEEREAIARGENVKLLIWGTAQPPVAVITTDEPLGKAP